MKVCSSFDSDCMEVPDPFECWMGHPGWVSPNGILFPALPVADGKCPLVEQTEKITAVSKVEK